VEPSSYSSPPGGGSGSEAPRRKGSGAGAHWERGWNGASWRRGWRGRGEGQARRAQVSKADARVIGDEEEAPCAVAFGDDGEHELVVEKDVDDAAGEDHAERDWRAGTDGRLPLGERQPGQAGRSGG
jgi:hypothetical protein